MSDATTTETDLPAEPVRRESGRHPINVGHLVMGIAFLGLALVWSLYANDVVEGRDVRWLLPVPWVLAGAAGLTVSAVSGHRKYQTRQTGWVGHTEGRPEDPENTQTTENPENHPEEQS